MIDLASILTLEDGAFVVGGQALNLWAEYYARRTDELERYRPYTSKDLDYFGLQDAARRLAEELDGQLLIPDMDNATFESAVVEAVVDGHELRSTF